MKLVGERGFSRSFWTIIFAALFVFLLLGIVLPYGNRRLNHRQRIEVEKRYRELVADGKLEQPAEGFQAVTFSSQHGGAPFTVWFRKGTQQRGVCRYHVSWSATPEGKSVWQFQDFSTKQYIY